MIAGELESLDRFQLMERCRMLVGIFEKVALYEFGIEVWDGLDAWEMPKKTAYDHPSGPPCRARLDLVIQTTDERDKSASVMLICFYGVTVNHTSGPSLFLPLRAR